MRYLFACTTHPTDLSPENLWRNLEGSIRAFSYLDKGILTDFTTDLVVANNNNCNACTVVWVVCVYPVRYWCAVRGGVVAVSVYMSGSRGSGVLSSVGDVLEMSVVRGVYGVCDMCMCLARGGVRRVGG